MLIETFETELDKTLSAIRELQTVLEQLSQMKRIKQIARTVFFISPSIAVGGSKLDTDLRLATGILQ